MSVESQQNSLNLNPLSDYYSDLLENYSNLLETLLEIIKNQKKLLENSSDKQLQQASDANVLLNLAWKSIKYYPPGSRVDYFDSLDPKPPLSLDLLKQLGSKIFDDALNALQARNLSEDGNDRFFFVEGISTERYSGRLPRERDFNELFSDEIWGFTTRYKLAEMIIKTALLVAGWRHLIAKWNSAVMALPEEIRKSAELLKFNLLSKIYQCEIDLLNILGNGNWNFLSIIEKVYMNEEITDDDLQSLLAGYQIGDRQMPSNEDLRAIEPDIREEFLFDLYIHPLVDKIIRYEINFPEDAAALQAVLEKQLNRFPELREKAEKHLFRGRLEREESERRATRRLIIEILQKLLKKLQNQEFERRLKEDLQGYLNSVTQYQDGVFSAERLGGRDFGHAHRVLLSTNKEILAKEEVWWNELSKLLVEIQEGKWPKDLFLAVLRQRWPEWHSGEPVDLLGYESEDPDKTGWRE